jgi:anaerobic selenocysteine-containing dehydrogenase
VLHRSEPVLPAAGEARGNYRVFADLALRAGVARADEIPSEERALELLLAATTTAGELDERGYARPDCGEAPVQFVDVFPRTADRQVDLVPDALDREAAGGLYSYRPDPDDERFPLALVSPATSRTISSTFGQLRRGPVALEIHPSDAAARALATGDRVRVWNEFGEVRCTLRVASHLRPGVLELPKGLWSHNTENGATANALVSDALTDLGGGATFNDARVEVERI